LLETRKGGASVPPFLLHRRQGESAATTAPLGIHTTLASAQCALSDGEKFALATLQSAFG
jgi:hypothetical protein